MGAFTWFALGFVCGLVVIGLLTGVGEGPSARAPASCSAEYDATSRDGAWEC